MLKQGNIRNSCCSCLRYCKSVVEMSRLEYQLNPLLFSIIDSNENLLKLNRLALRSLSALISWFRLCLIISNGNHLNKSILELYLLSLIIVHSGKRIFDNRAFDGWYQVVAFAWTEWLCSVDEYLKLVTGLKSLFPARLELMAPKRMPLTS